MVKIVHTGDPILRKTAQEVSDTQSKDVQRVIADMKAALSDERFGVAIAAPQIGESLRIFVVAGKIFALDKTEEEQKEEPDQVFINPKVMNVSKKKQITNEGCLSVPGKYGTRVEHAEKITISYQDESGTVHERGASGFLAQIFEHEIDHLNGILYTDHALEVIDVDENMKPINSDENIDHMRESRENN